MAKLGRPLAMSVDDRRQEIFNIAEKLFGEQGFEHVTMNQIALAAGMSKKTLYVYFSDKRQLLQSLVGSSYIWSEQADTEAIAEPISALKHLFDHIVQHVLSDRHIKLCRLAIAEQVNIEGSSHTFYEMGISTSRRHLVAALNRIPRELYRLPFEPDQLSDILFGAVIAKPFLDALIIGKVADHAAIEQILNQMLSQCFIEQC